MSRFGKWRMKYMKTKPAGTEYGRMKDAYAAGRRAYAEEALDIALSAEGTLEDLAEKFERGTTE